jgi:hypothetical protein
VSAVQGERRGKACSIGEAAVGAKPTKARRTFQKVWRHSVDAGSREAKPWIQHNTFPEHEHNGRMRALEELERVTRGPGKRNGAAGQIALEVYRFLLRLRDRRTGRLDPSLAWIAAQINRARSAVARALMRLRDLKFLEWQRRTQPVEDPEPGGQYTMQISNAYILKLDGDAAELVARILRKPTEIVRRVRLALDRQRRNEETARLSTGELIEQVSDPVLRRIFTRMHAKVDSANPPGPMNGALCGNK